MADNPQQELKALEKAVEVLDKSLQVGHEVAEIIPHSEKKGEIIQVAGGSKASIAMQESLVMANYQMMNNAFGFATGNFKVWAKNFEECFPFVPKVSRMIDGGGNGINPWMQGVKNRPRIRILNLADRDKEIPTYLYIEFYPERENENEVYFIEGTQINCVERIWQIWYMRQIIKGMDVAQVLGLPPSEWIKKRPGLGVSIKFVLWSVPSPYPWQYPAQKNRLKKIQISIPFAKRSALKWDAIKAALGNSNGLKWGNYACTAYVADDISNYPKNKKGMPQIWCRGSSNNEAKENLKRILPFSEGKLVTLNYSNPDTSEDLNPNNSQNEAFTIYPIYMYVMNAKMLDFSSTKGRETRLGKLDTKQNRFELFHSSKPAYFDKNLDELMIGGN